MNNVSVLMDLAQKHGVELIERPNGHYQLKGQLLVNYYPESKNRSAYVAGTKRAVKHVAPDQAIGMCFTPPPFDYNPDRRGKNSRQKRAALIRKGVRHCFWCGDPVDIDTSTLEHIIPLARGGLDNANNRTLACLPCNSGRGCDMPELKSFSG